MNISKIIEDEINDKLGCAEIKYDDQLFDNNIIFFLHEDLMYFNKNMLKDLFSDSANKLIIVNYIDNNNNIWPLDFLHQYNISFDRIIISDINLIKISYTIKKNIIYRFFYFIDISNSVNIYTKNQYKNHVIYIKSISDIYNMLLKIFTKYKKNINFKNNKHEELIDICKQSKQLFKKYINIIYMHDNVYAEIEINDTMSSIDVLKNLLISHNIL